MPLEESDADTDLKDKKQVGEVVGEGGGATGPGNTPMGPGEGQHLERGTQAPWHCLNQQHPAFT